MVSSVALCGAGVADQCTAAFQRKDDAGGFPEGGRRRNIEGSSPRDDGQGAAGPASMQRPALKIAQRPVAAPVQAGQCSRSKARQGGDREACRCERVRVCARAYAYMCPSVCAVVEAPRAKR